MASVEVDLRPCEEGFFDCDAVELARNLLGKYLWCPLSDVGLIRIVETEAYPVIDAVYRKNFGADDTQRAIPNQAGVLVRLSAALHLAVSTRPTSTVIYPDNLYITAKCSAAQTGFKPVVLLRSCMPQYSDGSRDHIDAVRKIEKQLGYTNETSAYLRINLLINPHVVYNALSKEFESDTSSDPVLFREGGCRLVFRADVLDPIYPIMHGPRVLDLKNKFRSPCTGTHSMYRFALFIGEMNYSYAERESLELLNLSNPATVPSSLANT